MVRLVCCLAVKDRDGITPAWSLPVKREVI